MNQDIYSELITKSEYKVESNVRNKTLRLFIKYLVHREIPDINIDNINEYELLSKEFDIMNNLIEIIKKSILENNFHLIILRNQSLKKSIQAKKDTKNQKSQKYQQIISLLFNNIGFYTLSDFLQFKTELLQSCTKQDLSFVDYLTRKKVEENGLLYILNETEKTAGLFKNFSSNKDILIPKSIIYQSQEYLITKIVARAFEYDGFIESIQFSKNSELKIIEEGSFSGCSNLKSISIPSTVTHIGAYAFNSSVNLKSVTFSEDSELRSIGEFAFNMNSIESITIPSKVVELKNGLFYQFHYLTNINLMSGNKNFIFYEDKFILGKTSKNSENFDVLLFAKYDIETAIIPSFIKVIAPYSFYLCRNLKKICFQENSELNLIGRSAFYSSFIESVLIPSHVNKISSNCFENCTSLNKVEFSKESELKIIKKSSFYGSSIVNISIPSSVIELGKFAFAYCREIKSVDFDENSELRIINKNLFYNSNIESFTIPSKVVELKNEWCNHSPNLKNIKIMKDNKNFIYYEDKFLLGKTNENFDVLLFARRDIEIANIPSFIKVISPCAFNSCIHLKKVIFSEDSELISIGQSAFSNSTIESILIPSNITTIEKYTFAFCQNLKKVAFSINSKLKVIKKYAFNDSSLEEIIIPSGVIKIEENAFSCCQNIKSIEFDKDSKLNSIESNVFSFSSLNRILIPKNVTHIYDSFRHCHQLRSVEIPENSELKIIGQFAFTQTLLETFSIPSKLIEFKEGWCCDNTNLKTIKINQNNKNFIYYENKFLLGKSEPTNKIFDVLLFVRCDIKKVTIPSFIRKINSYAFNGCQNLNIVHFQEKSNLKIIGDSSFSCLLIDCICIPPLVAQIGEWAFSDCDYLNKICFSHDSKLNKICESAFRNLPLKSIVIPSHVNKIEDFAFANCKNLQIIEFNKNSLLNSIGIDVFQGVNNVVIMIPNII